MPSSDEIEAAILRLARLRGAGKTICPSEAARDLAGDHPDDWSRLMPAIRLAAIRLMKADRVVITRKGKPADPDDFRGVYRIRISAGEGSGDDR